MTDYSGTVRTIPIEPGIRQTNLILAVQYCSGRFTQESSRSSSASSNQGRTEDRRSLPGAQFSVWNLLQMLTQNDRAHKL
jgi:hypothetical protein